MSEYVCQWEISIYRFRGMFHKSTKLSAAYTYITDKCLHPSHTLVFLCVYIFIRIFCVVHVLDFHFAVVTLSMLPVCSTMQRRRTEHSELGGWRSCTARWTTAYQRSDKRGQRNKSCWCWVQPVSCMLVINCSSSWVLMSESWLKECGVSSLGS